MKTEAAIKQGRDTAGKISYELMQKDTHPTRVVELGEAMTKDYMEKLWECVDRGKKASHIEGDFYAVVLSKKERLLTNVIRNFFLFRQSCPTPTFCQSVYKYYPKEDKLDLLWTLPSQEGAAVYRDNALLIDPSEKEMLNYVLDYWDGTLDKLAQTLNGEEVYDLSLRFK